MVPLQMVGGVGVLFVGAVLLLFLVVSLAVIGGFLLLRRDRSPAQQRLDRLEDQMEELQRRVDRIEER